MPEIIPAILSDSYKDIAYKARVMSEVSPWVQVDVVDGVYAPHKTWPFVRGGADADSDFAALVREDASLPEWEDLSYEFDLMVADPAPLADALVAAGASRIIVHYGSFTDDAARETFFADFKKKYGMPAPLGVEIVLALGADVLVSEVARYAEYADGIQLMGIKHVGAQGEAFEEATIERVTELRARMPEMPIAVDGGVNEENIRALAEAGATRLAVGSAIWKTDDPAGEVEYLQGLLG